MSSDKNFSLTGNENECFYTYTFEQEQIYKFSKTIKIMMEEDYDVYEETFTFPTYSFTIGKRIPKVEVSGYLVVDVFVKNFTCDIQDETYCVREKSFKGHHMTVIQPNEIIMHDYYEQLYDKYVEYYDQVVNAKPNVWYAFLDKNDNKIINVLAEIDVINVEI